MKKMKLNKVTISALSDDVASRIKAGDDVKAEAASITTISTITIPVTITIIWRPETEPRPSDNPGTQDSCGLCTTHYAC